MDVNEVENHVKSEYTYMLNELNYDINQAVERIFFEHAEHYRSYSNSEYKRFIKMLSELCDSEENQNKEYILEKLKSWC